MAKHAKGVPGLIPAGAAVPKAGVAYVPPHWNPSPSVGIVHDELILNTLADLHTCGSVPGITANDIDIIVRTYIDNGLAENMGYRSWQLPNGISND